VASVIGWSRDHGHLRVLNKLTPHLDLETSVVSRVTKDNPGLNFLLMGPGLVLHQPTGVPWLRTAFSVGLGFGCGGARGGTGGCERGAGGISLGADLAAGELWGLKLYCANRLQLSLAEDVPATFWGLHVAGIQWDVWEGGLISLETGPWWYENRVEKRNAMIVTLGVGVLWDAR
jgi:hypothetical protein